MKTKLELSVFEYLESYYNIQSYEGDNLQEKEFLLSRLLYARDALQIPEKFYKFRTCNNVNFHALERNCIWMPLANHFLDLSDCNISASYNYRTIETNRLETEQGYLFCIKLLEKCLRYELTDLIPNDLQIIEETIKNITYKVTIENHRELLSGVLSKEKEDIYFEWIEFMHTTYRDALRKLPAKTDRVSNVARKFMHVFSMTSIMDNNLLWEHYANCYTGFCIEYRIPKDKFYDDGRIAQILPVIYKRNIPSVDMSYFDVRCMDKDSLQRFVTAYGPHISMQMLYKHIDYKFEHEWRMIGTDLESSLQPFPYVSRIIAGKDIKPRNYKRLQKIAERLNVPIIKQVFDCSLNKNKYV